MTLFATVLIVFGALGAAVGIALVTLSHSGGETVSTVSVTVAMLGVVLRVTAAEPE